MRFLFISIFICISFTTKAEPSWLYEVDVNPLKTHLTDALQKGLQEVVDRLTPGANDHENPVVLAANPAHYIVKKQTLKNGQLRLFFKPEAIKQLLIEAGQQPWVKNKPKLLTWVCLSKYQDKKCLYPKEDPAVFKALVAAAKNKGLELDFNTPSGLMGRNSLLNKDNLMDMLSSYAQTAKSEGVLLIELYNYPDKNDFMEKWFANYHGKTSYYTEFIQFKHPSEVGYGSMPGLTQFLFEQGEQDKIESHPVDVNISNINTAKAFYQVEKYVQHIPGVTRTTLNSVTADSVLYTLEITVPTQLLKMRLDQTYTPLPQNPDEDIMNYRLKTWS